MAPGGKNTPKKGKSPPKTKPQQEQVDDPDDNPGFALFENSNFVITGVGPTPQDNRQEDAEDEREEGFEDAEGGGRE